MLLSHTGGIAVQCRIWLTGMGMLMGVEMRVLINDIWRSLRALPLWVQLWIFGLLVPVNMAALLVIGLPGGTLVAALAVAGILPNVYFILRNRGFSKVMALSHVLFWLPLICVIGGLLAGNSVGPRGYYWFLWLLLGIDMVSLMFDLIDSIKWLRGDRAVA